MPFVRIELAGSATREQKAALVADVTQSLVERLGKPAGAVQIVIAEHSTENYGAAGILLADRAAAAPTQEVAPANGSR
ncbi:4-oxalocrotonate tautomerase family protein [Sphingomonas sp. AP4-R1]|uniref:tautomerase family protein n=1 Tax=Sphingomonas sp. AP4-R1 TaxID=2735134 RepID=UPI0014936F97|nr:4-oxalocrotonate tautomerase family protein [Sphingomonas sp. AP4-R1]QJU57653.1 4-oxalocrotonate tautomerase family protein [Sphingomonas sp. AP4-R1]